MKKLALIITMITFSGLALAGKPTPEDFFQKAVKTYEPNAKEIRIVVTYNPFAHASRVLQYLDRLAQQTVDSDRIAYAFYRIKYIETDGTIQDCTAGLGYKLGFPQTRRLVEISGCNEDFLHATTKFHQVVDL